MRISRIGFTPLKGGRHQEHSTVDLGPDGPVGDRVFCLVDPARGRVLRTVEHPTLVQTTSTWRDGFLATSLPGGSVEDEPQSTGCTLEVDYWGRAATLEVVAGPWAGAFTEHLGYDVLLARSSRPGEIVYGASVTIVTTSSLDLLARRVGAPILSPQFRSTMTVDTDGLDAHVEDGWVGRTLTLGEAQVAVRGVVPRCAVVDLDPLSGTRRTPALRTLAGYRQDRGEVVFGVDAVVTRPGRVVVGTDVVVDAAERG